MPRIFAYIVHKAGVADDTAAELIAAAKKIDAGQSPTAVATGWGAELDAVCSTLCASCAEVWTVASPDLIYPTADFSAGAVINVRPGAFKPAAMAPVAGEVADKSSQIGVLVSRRRYLETIVVETGDVDISKETVPVSIGRGIQEQDNIGIAEELAAVMGAAVSAHGFVMGEGAAIFLLKRLADAERDKDQIYAVLRGIGGSSDGKGKGITAPNPVGQRLCIERAWKNAGLSPGTVTYVEGHGTSTKVGDVVEAQSLTDVLSDFHLAQGSIALGSVKSNIGHLKGAAGAAGLLKATFALRDRVIPPSIHCEHRNPDIDFSHSPLYVNTELQPWSNAADGVRRAGLSAFGFGGTNFHAVRRSTSRTG